MNNCPLNTILLVEKDSHIDFATIENDVFSFTKGSKNRRKSSREKDALQSIEDNLRRG